MIKDRVLIIRAAPGSRPVFAMSSEGLRGNQPLLRTNASLRLEGLKLQRLGSAAFADDETIISVISAESGELKLAHYRVLINRRAAPQFGIHCIGCDQEAKCELRSCEVFARGAAIGLGGAPAKLENCLIAGEVGLMAFRGPDHSRTVPISLRANTILARHLVQWNWRGSKEEAEKPKKAWICDARENVFTGNVCFNQEGFTLGGTDYLPADAAASLLPRIVEWPRRQQSLPRRRPAAAFRRFQKTARERWPSDPCGMASPVVNPIAWIHAWEPQVPGRQLNELLHKAYTTHQRVRPEEFSLRPDSPGHQAGRGKRDLGADANLLGPSTPLRPLPTIACISGVSQTHRQAEGCRGSSTVLAAGFKGSSRKQKRRNVPPCTIMKWARWDLPCGNPTGRTELA